MKKRFLSVVTISALVALGTFAVTSCQPETPVETTKYKVTYSTGGGYNLTGLKTEGYAEGETVTFKVEPDSGKRVTEVKAGSETLTANASGEYSFTMGTSDVTITVTVEDIPTDATITLDKETIRIDELGKTETISATVTNFTGTIEWTTTDDTKISITPSADGKTCTVTNVGGGSAVVTATAGTAKANAAVTGSIYGDLRKTYTIHKSDGTVYKDDIKGLYNAVGILNADPDSETLNGYVTEKGSTEVLYKYYNAYLSSLGKEGPTDELAGNKNWNEDGKAVSWYGNYQLDVDLLSETNTFNTLTENGNRHANFNRFDARAINYDSTLFADGYMGYSDAGNPSGNVWSGYRASSYVPAVTGAQYITWADPYEWGTVDMTWDLSDSQLMPSYNENQGVFAQIYIGSSNKIQKIAGMYFDAGTMEECLELEDGATKEIYTFEETLNITGGLSQSGFGQRTIGETAIGEAVWDAFNKVWTFPDFEVRIVNEIYFKGEYAEDTDANYFRNYHISGIENGEVVETVDYTFTCENAAYDQTRGASQERTMYGATLTPNYGNGILPDITCGAKWLNLKQGDSIATSAEGLAETLYSNLQFFEGRTVNGANQLGLLGADCLTGYLDANNQSIFNFEY